MMINSTFDRVSKDQVARAKEIASTILADVAGRRGALDGRIKPVSPTMRVCGPALTVEVRPGDNLMIHAALVLAQPGDVIVVDGKADTTCALMGELMCAHARAAGVAGVVIDAAVRDVTELKTAPFPVFACGSNPNGPTKRIGGRIGHAISVGGVAVEPGDLVVGNEDGVVIIPKADVEHVLTDGLKKIAVEHKRLEDIAAGRLIYGWLEGTLKEVGALPTDKSLRQLIADFAAK